MVDWIGLTCFLNLGGRYQRHIERKVYPETKWGQHASSLGFRDEVNVMTSDRMVSGSVLCPLASTQSNLGSPCVHTGPNVKTKNKNTNKNFYFKQLFKTLIHQLSSTVFNTLKIFHLIFITLWETGLITAIFIWGNWGYFIFWIAN